MPAVIEDFDSLAAKFFVAFPFMLAAIDNPIAAGTYPLSNDATGLCPNYINISSVTIIVSVFYVICTPWSIIENTAGPLGFRSSYPCVVGLMAVVMVVDFYLFKKRKFNIYELYEDNGINHYSHGTNGRGFAAFGIGFMPLIPSFAKRINTFQILIAHGR